MFGMTVAASGYAVGKARRMLLGFGGPEGSMAVLVERGKISYAQLHNAKGFVCAGFSDCF